jgi:glutamyl endopeptidase
MDRIYKKGFSALLLCVALLLVVGTAITTAQDFDTPEEDLDTPMFSDESVEMIMTSAAERGLEGSAPFEGTGELTEEALRREGVIFATDIEEFEELEPATGGLGIETIIGMDTRVRVRVSQFPARATCFVKFTGGWCTGWMYDDDTVATAGHCVHTGGTGGSWRTNVKVYPGRFRSYRPYGYCTAKWLGSVVGWTVNKNKEYDYGVIKLNCTVGNATGWYGMWWQTASLTGDPTVISGYPGDELKRQLWSFYQVGSTSTRQVFYKNDTLGGMSGAPVWHDRPPGSPYCSNGPCAMGIHAYGLHGSPPHSTHNSGTRITQARFDNFMTWAAMP